MGRIGASLAVIRCGTILLASFCLAAAVGLDVNGTDRAVFQYQGGKYAIPYSSITSLDLSSKRAFFSKKKRLILTIGFSEEGSKKAAVIELSDQTARATMKILEERSGRRIVTDPDNSESVAHAAIPPTENAFTPLVDVTFYSTPPGATVSMYGRTIGCTPFITRLEPGSYKATFSATGRADVTQQLMVKPYKPSMVRVDLGAE